MKSIKNKSISNVNTIKKYINESFDVRKSRGENSNSQSESINLNFNDTYNDIYKRTNNGIENNQTKNATKLSNSKLSNDTGMTNKKNDFNHTHYMQKGTKSVTKKKESLNKFNKKNIQQSIINMLNKKSGKNFKINSPISIKLINERLKEGYVLEDFYKVIEVKVAKWKNTIMEMYIRPETLFSYKFESYVNENISMKSQSNVHQCKEGTSNDSSNYIHSDYTTYDDSMRERKKYENVRYWNPICEI
ncbi:conserved phage C-terminal domain-containing protein [Clostridioides sp. ZZV15-6383]|nr:conserved phage C-terminal domain-containing protein [Clostridioides sp. ZZV15-6383]